MSTTTPSSRPLPPIRCTPCRVTLNGQRSPYLRGRLRQQRSHVGGDPEDTMRITFKPLEGPEIPCTLPYQGATYVVPAQAVSCPCGLSTTQLQGGETTHDHDTYYAPVRCTCGAKLGQLRVKVSTVFGIEEDERVLNGRPRVY